VDFLSGRHRTLVGLEPTFGQELARCGEILLNVAHYKMREYDMCLRMKRKCCKTRTDANDNIHFMSLVILADFPECNGYSIQSGP
jgi:hypothetical protein